MAMIQLLIGFYLGGGFVTSIVVGETVNGEKPSWLTKLFMVAAWPLVLLTAAGPDEE